MKNSIAKADLQAQVPLKSSGRFSAYNRCSIFRGDSARDRGVEPMLRALFFPLWIGGASFALSSAQAQLVAGQAQVANSAEQTAAQNAALAFVTRFDEGNFEDIYDRDMSAGFRTLMSKQLFVQQAGFQRLQSGGRALARELIGSQSFTQTPTGQTGAYYYVRFRTRHPNGLIFQDVYLEKVGDAWLVLGYYPMAAPQQ